MHICLGGKGYYAELHLPRIQWKSKLKMKPVGFSKREIE